MHFEMEELVPIVAKLAERYTSKESSSISYEKAWQLMDAVLYCIQESNPADSFAPAALTDLSAEQLYETGLHLVEEKMKNSLRQYNQIMTHFSSYQNNCLYDTVVRGMPEFFKWYDCRFEPQNTILSLDYPVLSDLSHLNGVDRIYEYLLCIELEQRFFSCFSTEFIINSLFQYHPGYRKIIDNLCEIVLMNVLLHFLCKKKLTELNFSSEETDWLKCFLANESVPELRDKLNHITKRLVQDYFHNDAKMLSYLSLAVQNISTRIKISAKHDTYIFQKVSDSHVF